MILRITHLKGLPSKPRGSVKWRSGLSLGLGLRVQELEFRI